MNLNVEKFKIIGSTSISNFYKNFKNEKKNNFDICLVAEYPYFLKGSKEDLNSQKEIGSFLTYLSEFINKNKLKLVIIGKRPKIDDISLNEKFPNHLLNKYISERKFYEKFLNSKHLYIPQDNKILSSYKYSMQSEVTIGTTSTILRELLSANKKILACNPFGEKNAEFPIKGICYLENFDFTKFEQRLKKILNISNSEYFGQLEKDPNHLVKFDKNSLANDIIIKEIKNSLKHA